MRSWMIAGILGIAVVAWFSQLPHRGLIYTVLFILALLSAPLSQGWRRYYLRQIFLILLAGWLGLTWAVEYGYSLLDRQLPIELEGRALWVEGEVVGIPTIRDIYQQFDLKVHHTACAELPACSPKVKRLRLKWYGYRHNMPVITPGDKWQLLIKAKRPYGAANPGGFDYQSWLIQQGIGAVGYVRADENNRLIGTASLSVDRWRWQLQQWLNQSMESLSHRGILIALLTGDKGQLSPAVRQIFADTGTSHLMVISGLHIGLMAAIGYWLGRLLAVFFLGGVLLGWRVAPEKIAVITGMLVAIAYSGAAGFSLPTQRALTMIAVVMLAILMRRQLVPGQGLLVALVLCLIIDPLAPVSLSFWLSFGAVAVILFGVCGRITATRWKRWFSVQWLVFIGLLPVTAFTLGTISYVSPLANTLAVPLFSLLIVPLNFLATLLSALSVQSGIVIWRHLNSLLQYAIHFFEWLNTTLTQGPMTLPALGLLPVILAVLAAILLLLPRSVPMRYVSLLLLAPLVFAKGVTLSAGDADVTVLDVGQGLSVVVQTAQHSLVYDLGPSHSEHFSAARSVVLPYLDARGINTLDLLVISHKDNDHAGDWPNLLKAITTQSVRMGETVPGLTLENNQSFCRAKERWHWDGVSFEFLYPFADYQYANSPNNHSCVLKITAGETTILLTGDIERPVELALVRYYRDQLNADILLAPHHGSRSSSSWPFVRYVSPTHVVFAAGYRSRFGHPHKEIVDRYHFFDSKTYNTATDGAVTFRIRQGQLASVDRYRSQKKRYWL